MPSLVFKIESELEIPESYRRDAMQETSPAILSTVPTIIEAVLAVCELQMECMRRWNWFIKEVYLTPPLRARLEKEIATKEVWRGTVRGFEELTLTGPGGPMKIRTWCPRTPGVSDAQVMCAKIQQRHAILNAFDPLRKLAEDLEQKKKSNEKSFLEKLRAL